MDLLEQIKFDRNNPMPIYHQIEQQLSHLITQNVLQPSQRMPSVPEMVEHLGINYRTARQAYQALAQKGMVNIITGKGTFVVDRPKQTATKVIGLLNFNSRFLKSKEISNFVMGVYHGIHLEAERLGWDCFNVEPSRVFTSRQGGMQAAGYIIDATNPNSLELQSELSRKGENAVTIGGDGSIFPMVRTDDQQGIQMIMNHLFALGHERIGLLNVSFLNYSAMRRFDAYCQAMASRNLNIHPTWIHNLSFSNFKIMDQQEDVFNKMFGSDQPPTAVITSGIELSMYMLQMLHRFKVRVPEEVSVCGYDDITSLEYTWPPLTAIRQPWEEIGRSAVRNLTAMISGQKVEPSVLPVELVVRASTAKVRA
jgi:DNA-binding LacI/PurR family transcriptional regulator